MQSGTSTQGRKTIIRRASIILDWCRAASGWRVGQRCLPDWVQRRPVKIVKEQGGWAGGPRVDGNEKAGEAEAGREPFPGRAGRLHRISLPSVVPTTHGGRRRGASGLTQCCPIIDKLPRLCKTFFRNNKPLTLAFPIPCCPHQKDRARRSRWLPSSSLTTTASAGSIGVLVLSRNKRFSRSWR